MELATIFTATPAEIDGEIANLQTKLLGLHGAIDRVVYLMGQRTDDQDTVKIADLRSKSRIVTNFIVALQDEYTRRGGWARYYRVANSNGHVHTHTSCRNTYPTTEWFWVTSLSGATAEEVVEQAGELTCLTCFPTVRAEILVGRPCKIELPREKATREEREARAAKAVELAAKDAAKAIADVDGSVLLDDDNQPLKTLRAAQMAITSTFEWAGLVTIYADQAESEGESPIEVERTKRFREQAIEHLFDGFRLATAIAKKLDKSVEEVIVEHLKKADKKLAPHRKQEAARKASGKTASEFYG